MAAYHQLLIYAAVMVVAGLAGYLGKWRGWLREEQAAGFMKAAIVAFEAPLGLLAVWRLQMIPGTWRLPVAGLAVVVVMLLAGYAVSRFLGQSRLQRPSFAFGSTISNIGYTLGGFIALALLGKDGLSYQYIYVIFWPFFIFLVIFPIGHHYASRARLHPLQLVWKSLTDLRSLPIYFVTAGILLNQLGVAYPRETFAGLHLVEILLVGGIVCSYVGIGLSVSLRALRPYLKQSLAMCGLKFAATPVVMLGMVTVLGLTGSARELCLLLSFMPCGIYSVMVATLFGTDRDLTVTNFLVTHAVFFAVILPLVLPQAIGM